MRAVQMNATGTNERHKEPVPGAVPPGRKRPGGRRAREGTRSQPGSRLPGLRWVPAPLAVLAAVLGWLILGALQGQAAAHDHHVHGYQAAGLALTVDQMVWMSNDMTGQGPLKVPKGFPMDPSMMPGMQPVGDNRLHVEVDLRNITAQVQQYALGDFHAVAPGGKTFGLSGYGGSDTATTAVLEPGFQVTVDLYFDIPIQQSKNLSIEWSRHGSTVEFPVNTSGKPSPHIH